ncbi:MAG: hypothetical protein K0U70_10095 [Actinomycetia bacterium]|nr:hypothetical protein [Actinomycetes bacterium]MCH9708299.1 hypothetical protein [Actinomycetes bacterium]MCH9768135.1 hypothetical protein [Actinomycetes bacterium]
MSIKNTSLKRLYVAPLLIAAASVALAPVTAAQPAAGSESPTNTKAELERQGYQVTINWVNGPPNVVPLSQCVVTNINTVAAPKAYMSVSCPPAGSQ